MVRLTARKRSTPCYGPIAGRSAPTPLRSAEDIEHAVSRVNDPVLPNPRRARYSVDLRTRSSVRLVKAPRSRSSYVGHHVAGRRSAEHHHRLLLFATGAARRVAATQHRRWLPNRAGPWADHAAADEPPGGRSSAAAPRRSCRPHTRHDHRRVNPGTVPRTWAAREKRSRSKKPPVRLLCPCGLTRSGSPVSAGRKLALARN